VQGVLEYTEPEACLASEIIFMESTVYESVNRRVLYMNLCLFFKDAGRFSTEKPSACLLHRKGIFAALSVVFSSHTSKESITTLFET